MKNKSIIFLLNFYLIFAFAACQLEEENEPLIIETDGYAYITKDQAIEQSLNMVIGIFERIEQAEIGSKIFWKVFIVTESGSSILFEYLIEPGELWEITGLSPSFDYQFNPSLDVMNFNAARDTALKFKSGEIIFWKLRMDKHRLNWEYRFHIQDAERIWDVRFNAASGSLIKIG